MTTALTVTDIDAAFIRVNMVPGELSKINIPIGTGKMKRVIDAVQPFGPILFLSNHSEMRHQFIHMASNSGAIADTCRDIEQCAIFPATVILCETYRINSTVTYYCRSRQIYLIQL